MLLSGRNVQNTKIVTADSLNTYDVLNADMVILSEGSVEKIDNLLNKK
ncbi:MAG: 50S ribosomal protein L4 [Bacteroidota bacterium]